MKASPLNWHNHFASCLSEYGYKNCISDPCVFYKQNATEQSFLCIHVDDILMISSHEEHMKKLYELLLKRFKKVAYHTGDQVEYLGLLIKNTTDGIKISQSGYIQKLIDKYNIKSTATAPATLDILKYDQIGAEAQKETQGESKPYLELLMALNYLCITRPDISVAVSFLATKCVAPSKQDWNMLIRVLKYLNGTKEFVLTLKPKNLQIHTYSDASYNVHKKSNSHTGIIISIGPIDHSYGATVFTASKKQQLIAKSSAEAELVAADEALDETIYLIRVLKEIGLLEYNKYKSQSILHMDNQSAMKIMSTGKTRAKHMNLRYYFIKSKIEDKSVHVIYMKTDQLYADFLTKPLTGTKFKTFRDQVMQISK